MGGYGKGKYGGSWSGAGWGDEWSGAWKGSKKGKGKWQEGEEEATAPETGKTGRILSRYQFSKAVLKTAADADGSAFVKDQHQKKLDDASFLGHKNLKKMLGPENHHLVRRPGVGLSEAAGSIAAGAAVAESLNTIDWEALKTALGSITAELQVINTLDATVEHSEKRMAEALEAILKKFCGDPGVEENAIKATIAGSRLFLMRAHLLPLMTALGAPGWWAENIPDALSEHSRFKAWKKNPKGKAKMFKGLAALLAEKIEEGTGAGRNDAAALFGRKRKAASEQSSEAPPASSQPGSSSSSGSNDAKKKKAKKDTKAKKTKKGKEAKKDDMTSTRKRTARRTRRGPRKTRRKTRSLPPAASPARRSPRRGRCQSCLRSKCAESRHRAMARPS